MDYRLWIKDEGLQLSHYLVSICHFQVTIPKRCGHVFFNNLFSDFFNPYILNAILKVKLLLLKPFSPLLLSDDYTISPLNKCKGLKTFRKPIYSRTIIFIKGFCFREGID